jgi:hypothetical protein
MRAARALLASTSAMDLGFDYRDGRLLCAASLTAKAGSDMDGWSSAPIDLSTLSGRLSGKGSIELLMAADWARLWPRMETMLAALYELYPAPARDAMRTLMTSYGPVYEIAGPIVAAEGDVLGDDGMHLVMQMAPRDAKSFLSAIETVMARPECAQIGARFTKVASPDADGAIVREYLLQYDPAKMLGEQASGAQAQKQMTAVVKAMFGGGGMPMRFAAKDGRAVVTLGKPKEDVASSLAGNRGGWSPLTGEALRQVGDCNPMLIERIDMGALMSGMARMMPAGAAGKPMPKVPAGSSADFVFRAGIRDREWRFGLAIDVIGFSKMMKAAVPR